MLDTIALVCVLLWLLGFVTAYTLGGYIHLLLAAAAVVVALRIAQHHRVALHVHEPLTIARRRQ